MFRDTDTRRIYGATFIDNNTACVFHGSRLDKEFLANALQEHFAKVSTNTEHSITIAEMPHDDISQAVDFFENMLGIFSLKAFA